MKVKIISAEKLNKLFDEDKHDDIDYVKTTEFDGLQYSVWKDRRTGEAYARRETRCVHMGFNSNEDGKEEEFLEIMKREGMCNASWGVTGRTMHQMLACQLAAKFPEYEWDIGYNYKCTAKDPHRLVLQAGFEPIVEM